jgi:hypothetical protein
LVNFKLVERVRFCASDGKDGGRSRTRTYDPLIKSQLLYHLSYAPILIVELRSTKDRNARVIGEVEWVVYCLCRHFLILVKTALDASAGLGLAPPDMNKEDCDLNDYVYERSLGFILLDGIIEASYMCCYNRDGVVLEAKQSPRRIALQKQENIF